MDVTVSATSSTAALTAAQAIFDDKVMKYHFLRMRERLCQGSSSSLGPFIMSPTFLLGASAYTEFLLDFSHKLISINAQTILGKIEIQE